MYSSNCLTNRAALGCVSTATGMFMYRSVGETVRNVHHQSSSGMCFHGYAACTGWTLSPTELLQDVFTAKLHVHWDFLVNRAALGCVSTATLHVHFGLSHQQNSSGSLFSFSRLHCMLQFRLSHQQSSSGMNSLDCLTNRAALGWVSMATLHTVWTVSPIEQLWDGFPWLRCMNSLDCLTNRAALGWVSTATFHEQFGLSYQQSSSGMGFTATLHEQFGLSYQQSSSGMDFHGYGA